MAVSIYQCLERTHSIEALRHLKFERVELLYERERLCFVHLIIVIRKS